MSTQKHPEYRPRCEHRRTFAERRILALAVPAFGALIAEPIFVLTDSALIGQLGKAELAGMSIAATLVTTVVGLMNFLAYSVTPAVAQPSARRTCAAPGRLVWTACVAFGLGMLLMIAGYAFADLAAAASARPTKP